MKLRSLILALAVSLVPALTAKPALAQVVTGGFVTFGTPVIPVTSGFGGPVVAPVYPAPVVPLVAPAPVVVAPAPGVVVTRRTVLRPAWRYGPGFYRPVPLARGYVRFFPY